MRRRPLRAALAPAIAGWLLAFVLLFVLYGAVAPAGAGWERSLLLRIHAAASPAWFDAATAVSRLGYPSAIVPITVVLLLWWLVRRAAWKAWVFLLATVALTALDYGSKAFFHRARPALFPHPFVAGAAYPSGHALFAVGYYGLFAYLGLAGAAPALRGLGWFLWALLAAAIGFSRLVLGVHWPTDVLAGYAAGAVVLLAMAAAARRVRR
jgi:undecaprenyl-diphosphatase